MLVCLSIFQNENFNDFQKFKFKNNRFQNNLTQWFWQKKYQHFQWMAPITTPFQRFNISKYWYYWWKIRHQSILATINLQVPWSSILFNDFWMKIFRPTQNCICCCETWDCFLFWTENYWNFRRILNLLLK